MKNVCLLLAVGAICFAGAHSASIQVQTLEEPSMLDSSNRDLAGIVKDIEEIIKKTIVTVQEVIKKTADDLTEALVGAGENIIAIATDARKQVADAIAELKNQVQANLAIAKKCIDDHKTDIDQVNRILEENLENCADEYQAKVQAARQKVRAEIDELLKLAATAKDIVLACISENGPIAGGVCILEKSKELRSELSSQIAIVQDVLVKSLGEIRTAVKDGRNCVRLAADIAQLEMKTVLEKINRCIDESPQNVADIIPSMS